LLLKYIFRKIPAFNNVKRKIRLQQKKCLMPETYKYCDNLYHYSRRESREVYIGGVPLGGQNPIRIQSMTITDTMNTADTVDECIRIIHAGSDYVRITAPSIREAENLKNIKTELRKKRYNTPLIADIHYTPHAAEAAARIVEKVRINPGNYANRKRFRTVEYTDESYNEELERIYERFSPLVKICKEYGTAMRIGTNHGSLSDRIMSRYGDTPLGMVESALEFVRICEDHKYYDIVLSMKASNPVIMVQAYRLLVHNMDKEGMNYPLHLGVTEAGEGEDGRIKSAIGIGTLLDDGLGDTIRVSLTEPPENEIPAAKNIVKRYELLKSSKTIIHDTVSPINPFEYNRRETNKLDKIGGDEVPRVIADFQKKPPGVDELEQIGYFYDKLSGKWVIKDYAADYIYLGGNELPEIPPELGCIYDYKCWIQKNNKKGAFPLFRLKEYFAHPERSDNLNFISVSLDDVDTAILKQLSNAVLILEADNSRILKNIRKIFFELEHQNIRIPVIVKKEYVQKHAEEIQINSAIDIGGLLIDGFGDGVWMSPSTEFMNRTIFGILQAGRTRIYKTEYISCPSCGRTLFDLQETSARIREKTIHLKGLKIGIMGCIVNGPGEMADADYGYVGAGAGKISLYKGKEVVKKNLPAESAVDALIGLLKEDGKWVEPR